MGNITKRTDIAQIGFQPLAGDVQIVLEVSTVENGIVKETRRHVYVFDAGVNVDEEMALFNSSVAPSLSAEPIGPDAIPLIKAACQIALMPEAIAMRQRLPVGAALQ